MQLLFIINLYYYYLLLIINYHAIMLLVKTLKEINYYTPNY